MTTSSSTTPTPAVVDRVFLRNISFSTLAIGHDRWSRVGKPQPALLSVSIPAPGAIAAAAASDDIAHALDYSALCKGLQGIEGHHEQEGQQKEQKRGNGGFESVDGFVRRVGDVVAGCLATSSEEKKKQWWDVQVRLPNACKRVETTSGSLSTGGLVWNGTFTFPSTSTPTPTPTLTNRSLSLTNISLRCIVGINPHERLSPQTLRFDISLRSDTAFLNSPDPVSTPLEVVFGMVEASSYGTIEALAVRAADMVLEDIRDGQGRGWDEVTVVVAKPHAYSTVVDGPGVEVTRRRT